MSPVPRHKIQRIPEFREVIYDEKRWDLLAKLRSRALHIIEDLSSCGISAVAHGSLARGDVTPTSDVDIVITYLTQPYKITFCLEKLNYSIHKQYIVKATPASTPKAYIELDVEGREVISFPLKESSPTEWEFYKFGGIVTLEDLRKNVRKPGVNKNLVLIVPTERGHRETPVISYEGYVASLLGVSINVVNERVRLLSRRDQVGRTGTYLKYVLRIGESIEEALSKLIKEGRLELS
ncbi:MAG: nucleotidyltransferase domain-containing protein [Zestosphaera sp.]